MEVDGRSVYVGNVDYGATAEELEQARVITLEPNIYEVKQKCHSIPISWHSQLIICLSSGSKLQIVYLYPPEIWVPWYTISGNPETKNMDSWVLDNAYARSWVNFDF